MRAKRFYGLWTLGAAMLAAGGGRAEVSSDILTASNTVRQVSGGGNSYFLGSVAVGTNAPAGGAKLQVQGNADVRGGLAVSGAMTIPRQGDVSMGPYTNGVSTGGISGAMPAAGTGNLSYFNGTQWEAITNMVYSPSNGRLYFNGATSGTYIEANTGKLVMSGNISLNGKWLSGDGGNEGLQVDSAGKVGVGTASPATALHVAGPSGTALRVAGDSNGAWDAALVDFEADGAVRARVMGQKDNHASAGALTLATKSAAGALNDHMMITRDGAVYVDFSTTSTDSQGIRFYTGDGTNPRTRYVYLDCANGYFRVVGLNPATGQEVQLAVINSSSGWQAGCSKAIKKDITPLSPERFREILKDFDALEVYTYRREDVPDTEEVGVIAETTSPWIKGSSDDTVSPLRWLGYLTAVVKDQEARLKALEAEVKQLKADH